MGRSFDTVGCPNCQNQFKPQADVPLPSIQVAGISKCSIQKNSPTNPNNEGDNYATVEFSGSMGGVKMDITHTKDGTLIIINLRSSQYGLDIYVDSSSGDIQRTELRK